MDADDLEADDLLHSLALAESRAGGRTLILTGDRDMFQCASEDVTVLLQRTGGEGPEEIGPDGVRERYGIDPEQVPDFIALRGDPSDGLPGAKGIGAKTAADLLRRKGDLEHVILGAVREKPAVRRALIEQAAELRSFRDIAQLRTIDLERPPDAPTDLSAGSAAARALGMNRLAERLERLREP
jgi:DNA polymerase-1